MAESKKKLDEALRSQYIACVSEFLASRGEEVLVTNSNEIALPCVDSEGNDKFIVLTFKVPTGSRDGDAYDGYSMAEDYRLKVEEKAEKARVAAEEKAKKAAKDKAAREAKAAARAKAKATAEEKEG